MMKREMALVIQQVADGAGSSANELGRNEMERLVAAFGAATELFIGNCENEIALARALGDEETAVKEQIKSNVMLSAREIFAFCYNAISGERSEVWDETDQL